jgi:uncharacterized protein (DUF2249 family)
MKKVSDSTVVEIGSHEAGSYEAVLGAFDALEPGASLIVLSHHNPSELLGRLREVRRGRFEWSPVEEGPLRYRTQITRRTPDAPSLRGINEALAWDHDRLEEIEQRAFDLLQEGDPGARGAWADFSFGLRRHIRFEEELLFPAFERATNMGDFGPTSVMRAEHRQIEELISAIGEALAMGRDPTSLRQELHRVLGAHNMKEEQVLYPLADQNLGPAEADLLVARIQGV